MARKWFLVAGGCFVMAILTSTGVVGVLNDPIAWIAGGAISALVLPVFDQ